MPQARKRENEQKNGKWKAKLQLCRQDDGEKRIGIGEEVDEYMHGRDGGMVDGGGFRFS